MPVDVSALAPVGGAGSDTPAPALLPVGAGQSQAQWVSTTVDLIDGTKSKALNVQVSSGAERVPLLLDNSTGQQLFDL